MPGPERLRGVFEHRHAIFSSQGKDRFHVRALPIKMHGHDGLDVRRPGERLLQRSRRKIEGRGIDIREDGPRPQSRDTTRRGEKGIGRGDHRVARPNPKRHEKDEFRVRAGGNADRVLRAAVACHRPFKAFRLRPQDQRLGIPHGLDLLENLSLKRSILQFEIEERDVHPARMKRRMLPRRGAISRALRNRAQRLSRIFDLSGFGGSIR